jgi:hypothetical protein
MKARLTPAAFDDLQGAYQRGAQYSESFAERLERSLFEQLDLFELFAELGAPTEEEDVRRWPMGDFRYTIFYRINWQAERLDVLRIIDSSLLRNPKRVPRD